MAVVIKGFFNVVSTIINGAFGLTGTVIKYGALLSGVIIVTGIYTKPDRTSFDLFFNEWLKDNITSAAYNYKTNPILAKIIGLGGMTAVNLLTNKHMTDYGIFQIATVNNGDDKIYFAGTLNNWYYLGPR